MKFSIKHNFLNFRLVWLVFVIISQLIFTSYETHGAPMGVSLSNITKFHRIYWVFHLVR